MTNVGSRYVRSLGDLSTFPFCLLTLFVFVRLLLVIFKQVSMETVTKSGEDLDLHKVSSGGCVPIAQEPISRSTILIKIFIYLIIMGCN